MSIRTRLTIGVVLLLLGAFVLLGAAIVGLTRATLVAQVDARVLAATTRLELPVPRPPINFGTPVTSEQSGVQPPERPDGSGEVPTDGESRYERPIARLVYGPDGALLYADPSGYPDTPDPLPNPPSVSDPELEQLEGRIITLPASAGELTYRALIDRLPDGGIVVTAAPLSAVDDAVARIVQVVAIAAFAALALAAVVSQWLIGAGLRPVDQMIDTAAAIAAGDLTRRVPDATPQTELGRLGAALNDMLHQIEQALEARAASESRLRRFVADAAHELRTPLTSLRGYAELYRQGALTTPQAIAGAMGRIESEGARMARLVDDLLLLARLDQQRRLEREPVDLATVVREAATDFAAVEPDRPLSVTVAGEAIVLGDRSRLRQIVDNLLANVRTHTPARTPVSVTVRRTDHAVEVVVADEGPGIAPEAQSKVFERFWRGDPGRSRTRGGSGLGLAIVASLVQAHGGTVGVTSAPVRGATFTVHLPLAPPPARTVSEAERGEDTHGISAAPVRTSGSASPES